MADNAYEGRDVPDTHSDGLPEHPKERYFPPVSRHPDEQKDGATYLMFLTVEDIERARADVDVAGEGAYYARSFSRLGRPAQERIARIIGEKGQRIVAAAGLADFVQQHNIPVTGVERTVQ